VFVGCFEHVLDDKGRTSLPKEFRAVMEGLAGGCWITAYPRCISILSAAEFEAMRERLNGERFAIDAKEHLERMMLGMATPCSVDKQGRMLIPPRLRSWAGLERDIIFTGMGRRAEIWDRQRHDAELRDAAQNYAAYSRDVFGRSEPV
jgi:MraZ protein